MSGSVVTIDFHNTLIECDPWFELEIRTLVSSVLDWAVANDGADVRQIDRKLVDSEYRKLRLAIHAHGHELTAERAAAAVLDRVGLSLDHDVIATAIHELMHSTLQFARPVPGAGQFLREIHSAGARLAVVSSAVYHPFLEWALEAFSMRDRLEIVVTSASCGFYKSRPEIYWAALVALGGPANGATHVGDSLRFDVGGAAVAGLKTTWYKRACTSEDRVSEFAPDLVVTNLEFASGRVLDLLAKGNPANIAVDPK